VLVLSRSAEEASAATAPPPRVLVVEDNAVTRESLVLLLSVSGFDPRGAADGPEGLRQALEWRPDVVITDIGLPGLDGWQLGRAVREVLGQSVLLVALTGYGLPRDQQRSDGAGFDAHLTKPADPAALLELLRKAS
jgi:CheY-like chemotaxis protein